MNNLIKTKQGRRKEKRTEIRKIEETNQQRHVTFSKRRVGVFNKASELCALTGAECAIVCESYGGRIFAFGHPSVESVVDKYLGDKSSSDLPENNSETHVNSLCMHDKLKTQYSEIMKELEIQKKKSLTLKKEKHDNFNDRDSIEKDNLLWWQQPFEHLELEELEDYISSMETLRNNLRSRADDLKVIKTSSTMFDANKSVNSNESELSDEYSESKNLIAKDVGLMQELLMNENLNFNDDSLLNELLAMKDPKFDDDGLDSLLNDFYLQNNNVQLPCTSSRNTGKEVQISHVNGNLAVGDDYGKAVDLQNFDYNAVPNDFSCRFPPY